ncbi:MAG TPA: hypothetical protein VGY98_01425 [Verrucomicrobiae bacterium]|nr:hypothetical protein [Verrucomicrobiae bacterium]
MDIEEREIYLFLKTYGTTHVAAREICRRAGGRRRYDEDHEWAKPILSRMMERGILETNSEGQYRIKPRKKKKEGKWVSPDIAKILEESGLKVDTAGPEATESDDFYEQL